MHIRFFSVLNLLCIVVLLCCCVSWVEALDNIGGSDYGQIGPVVYYDPNTGQSRPFLPIGWYFWWPHAGPLLDEVVASGGNTVLFTSCADDPYWLWDNTVAAMDRAEELGLKAVIGFAHSMLMGVNYYDPPTYAHLIPWITEFRDHPALLGWQLGDENGGDLTAQMVNDAAHVFHRNDPHHQVWQVFSTHDDGAKLISYMQQTDISSFDRYGYLDGTGLFGGAAWILELQNEKAGLGADNGWDGNVNVVQGLGCDTGSFDYYRFPDYDEYRHLVFSAFASAGARGTLSWVYYYNDINWYTDPNLFTNWRDNICQPIQLEQQTIAHAMETGWNVGTVTANTDGLFISGPTGGQYGKVSHLLTYDDIQQFFYLIVTNNSYEVVNVELTLTELPDVISSLIAEIPESNSTVAMEHLGDNNFRLSDTLSDHEVKIYLLRADSDPQQCGDLGTIYFDADLVPDCYVKFSDFALLASEWLHCTNPADSNCDQYWNPLPTINDVYTDDFNLAWTDAYKNSGLRALHDVSSDWNPTHGGKAWHYLTEGTGTDDLQIYPQGDVIGNNYIGAVHTNEVYQRAAIDYKIDAGTVPYPWNFKLCLNFDGASDYYFNKHQYAIGLRGGSDMQVVKLDDAGAEEYTSGWANFATPSGDLDNEVWYRIELEKDGNVITGTVREKTTGTIVGQRSITDLGTEFTGGTATIRGYSAMTYQLDNFRFELGTHPDPASCGDDGTVYLDSDLYQDCYTNFSDLAVFVSQWLWCSDPNESDCDVYWK